jgi:hypothetical protein
MLAVLRLSGRAALLELADDINSAPGLQPPDAISAIIRGRAQKIVDSAS